MLLLFFVMLMVCVPHLKADCNDNYGDLCVRLSDMCDEGFILRNCKKTCGMCNPAPKPPVKPVKPVEPLKPDTPDKRVPMGNCGKPDVIGTRVIGGIEAARGSWPWQILLRYDGRPMCGGALIAPQWVVTAAHCVHGHEESGMFSVRVGEHDWHKNDGSERNHNVAQVFRHQDYDPRHLNNDIALLKLSTPVLFNKYVKPVCLPTEEVDPGTDCYITGWGKVQHPGSMFPKLQQAVLPVVSNTDCEKKNFKRIPIPITSAMICGGDGGTTKRSGCHGDSGGPYVCKVDGVWELHGAVSHGSPVCKSTETYTVFARVTHFRSWIDQTMAEN